MKAKIFFRNLGHAISFPFVAISLLIGLSKSKNLYKKYYSDPDLLSEEERYSYVYKQTSKATFIANCKINYDGIEKIPQVPVMYVCNHKAGFDPLLLIKIFSQEQKVIRPVFVSKIELLNNKNVGNAAKLIDTIFIDRKNLRSAFKCIEEEKKILAKRSVVVFIEGTRILSHDFGEFKSAALEPAFATMRPIVPVVIQGSVGVEQEDKKSFFKYKEINVRFLPCIKPTEFIHTSREGLAVKLRKIMLEKYNELEKENKSKLYDAQKALTHNVDEMQSYNNKVEDEINKKLTISLQDENNIENSKLKNNVNKTSSVKHNSKSKNKQNLKSTKTYKSNSIKKTTQKKLENKNTTKKSKTNNKKNNLKK